MKRLASKVPTGLVRLLAARVTGARFPHAVQANLTFRCNLRCVYCGITEDRRPEMTTAEVSSMVEQFAALGTSRISFTGGEPLLREDLPEIVRRCRELGLFVSVATNGLLVEKRLAALRGVSSVNLTLDGPEAIHDRQRGQGNFRTVLRAIDLLRSEGIPAYVNTVITRDNCALVREVLDIAAAHGVKVTPQPVFFSEQSHASNAEGYARARAGDEALIGALEELIRLKDAGDDRIMPSKRYYRAVIRAVREGRKIRCVNGGRLFCTVSPDGRVAPCNLLVRDPRWLCGRELGYAAAFRRMPPPGCDGCVSSFIDFDYLYSLKPDVAWNYYRSFLKLYTKPPAS